MRGNNSVSDLLETVTGILDEDREFTEREPVMIIDPDGDLLAIEFAAGQFPAPRVELESDQPPSKDPRQVANFARDKLNRSIATRVNPAIDRINYFGGAVIDSLRRIGRSQRALEDAVRRLAHATFRRDRELAERIAALEAEVAQLKQGQDS